MNKKTAFDKTTKKDKKSGQDLVNKLASDLLELMGTSAKLDVSEDKKNEAIVVDIQTQDEAGLLIGNRGRTLNSIQTLLGMMYRKQTGEWKRIFVDIADWREKEKERLEQLALQACERAKSTGEPQSLYNLTPSQRRIVHLALVGDKEVITESRGEGKDRYLVISPK